MSTRTITFSPEEYYHIYNRGNSKQIIFKDDQDYRYFTHLLFIANSEKHIPSIKRTKDVFSYDRGNQVLSIGAYCLMPNHFHLLIKAKNGQGVSNFMQKVSTGYAMYFNKKYKRTGALFEGKFKAQHVGNDTYFQYLFSYIHLNPAKIIDPEWKKNITQKTQALIPFVSGYRYSSYQDYTKKIVREERAILAMEEFPFVFIENSPEKSLILWFSEENSTAELK